MQYTNKKMSALKSTEKSRVRPSFSIPVLLPSYAWTQIFQCLTFILTDWVWRFWQIRCKYFYYLGIKCQYFHIFDRLSVDIKNIEFQYQASTDGHSLLTISLFEMRLVFFIVLLDLKFQTMTHDQSCEIFFTMWPTGF